MGLTREMFVVKLLLLSRPFCSCYGLLCQDAVTDAVTHAYTVFEVKENWFKLLLKIVCAHILNITNFQFLFTQLSKCGVRVRSSLQRRVPSQILSCRNVLTVKVLSHLLVSKGIPFVPKPALDLIFKL